MAGAGARCHQQRRRNNWCLRGGRHLVRRRGRRRHGHGHPERAGASGFNTNTATGAITIRSRDAGAAGGMSGVIALSLGATSAGASGCGVTGGEEDASFTVGSTATGMGGTLNQAAGTGMTTCGIRRGILMAGALAEERSSLAWGGSSGATGAGGVSGAIGGGEVGSCAGWLDGGLQRHGGWQLARCGRRPRYPGRRG